jgi:hypothetical protein
MWDKLKNLFKRPTSGNFFIAASSEPVAALAEKTTRSEGFYRVKSISGAHAGLGFICPRCCVYQIRFNAPPRVEHCGWVYVAPADLGTLPEIQLKSPQGGQHGNGVSTGRSTLVDLWGADSGETEFGGSDPGGGVSWR